MKPVLVGVFVGLVVSGILMAFAVVAVPRSTARWLPLPILVVTVALSTYAAWRRSRTPPE